MSQNPPPTIKTAMRALFHLFLDICLLRQGPQQVPASQLLLRLMLLTYGLSGLLVSLVSLLDHDLFISLLLTLVDIALLAGLTYTVLSLRGYGQRFVQTLTALLGTGTLLQLLVLPVLLWLDQEVVRDGTPELPRLLWFGVFAWSIAIMAHILHHALSVSRWQGLGYSLAYVLISWIASWAIAG
jgi:hypothetical protein